MTVGLCVDVVEIGLATHLRYIRPCTCTDGRTELQPEPLRGGGGGGGGGGLRSNKFYK